MSRARSIDSWFGASCVALLAVSSTTESAGQAPDPPAVRDVPTIWDPPVEWEKSYGGDKDEYGYSIVEAHGGEGREHGWSVRETPEGNYVVAGVTTSFNLNRQAYLLKADKWGEKLWDRGYSQGIDGAYSVICSSESYCSK